MNQQITPISEQDSQESYVYKNPVGGTIQKLYWSVSAEELRKYAKIQNSIPEIEIDLEEEISGIKTIIVKILQIPGDSYEASAINVGERTGSLCRISEPEFVGGINLYEAYMDNKDDEVFMLVLDYISHFVDQTLIDLKAYGTEFIFENAKVTGVSKGVMNIVVTDIASNIPHVVRLQEDRLYFYRYLLISLFQRFFG